MRQATKTAPDIIANCSLEQWKYGYGFWTNDYRQLWPNLPRDSFAASDAVSQHIWVVLLLNWLSSKVQGSGRIREKMIMDCYAW
jgi:hypothetical protein